MQKISSYLFLLVITIFVVIFTVSCKKGGLFGNKLKGTVVWTGGQGIGACGYKIAVEVFQDSVISYKPINLALKYQQENKQIRLTFETVTYPTKGPSCGPFIRIKAIKSGW